MAEAATVGAVARHRVVRVADEDDPRLERDLLAGEPVRIAGAVPALVAVAHDRADLLEPVDRSDDPLAELGMGLDDQPLRLGQATGLREDLARDADLADVVEERSELEPLQRPLVEAERLADAKREVADPARML